jgi:hypothetical protein
MPTATIQIDAGASGVMTRQRTVSGPDLTRFVAAVRSAYNVSSTATDIEALQVWADFVYAQAVATVRSIEQANAAAGIGSIGFS